MLGDRARRAAPSVGTGSPQSRIGDRDGGGVTSCHRGRLMMIPESPKSEEQEGPMAHPGFANLLPARETGAGGLQCLCTDAMTTCTWEGMKSWSGCTHQMVDAAQLEETSAARKPSRPSDSGGCGTWGSRRNALVRGPPWDSAPASQGPYPWLPCGARAITQRTPCLGKI